MKITMYNTYESDGNYILYNKLGNRMKKQKTEVLYPAPAFLLLSLYYIIIAVVLARIDKNILQSNAVPIGIDDTI